MRRSWPCASPNPGSSTPFYYFVRPLALRLPNTLKSPQLPQDLGSPILTENPVSGSVGGGNNAGLNCENLIKPPLAHVNANTTSLQSWAIIQHTSMNAPARLVPSSLQRMNITSLEDIPDLCHWLAISRELAQVDLVGFRRLTDAKNEGRRIPK